MFCLGGKIKVVEQIHSTTAWHLYGAMATVLGLDTQVPCSAPNLGIGLPGVT